MYVQNKNDSNLNELLNGYKRLKLHLINILCDYTQFCTICMSTDQNLLPISDSVNIYFWAGSFFTTLRNILDTLTCNKNLELLSDNICKECKDKAIQAYYFVYNLQHSTALLHNYVQQINDRITEVHQVKTSAFTECAQTFLVLQDPQHNEVGTKSENELLANNKEFESEIVKKAFVCDYCHGNFNRKQSIVFHIHQTHMKTSKTKSKKYSCCECEESMCIHHKYLMAYKEQRLAKLKTISCPDCDYSCYTKVDLITHTNKMHFKIFTSICEYCGKPLHSKKQYKIHIFRYHTASFACEYCDHEFKVEYNLIRHKRKCKKLVRCYKCDKCPASFSTLRRLEIHKNKHELKQLPCNLCNKVFSRRDLLKQHFTQTHTVFQAARTVHSFPCLICHEKFSTVKERKTHMSKHSSNEKYRCVICDTQHATLKDYKIHTRNPKHLLKANPLMRYKHKCSECNYSSISEQLLEAHVNRHHLKMAPYECRKCPRKFLTAKHLENHMSKHDSSKKFDYYCEICGNNFRSSTALQMHKRRHTGEKPYKCDVCEDRFVSASTRSVHKLKVHCERKFKCPLCEHMAPTLPYMRGHFRRVHWKRKGEKFDVRKVEGLREEDYELFRDRRLLNF